MFNNQRYITRGVESTVPPWLQNMMWYLIDSMNTGSKDYLQVFKLSNTAGKQTIVHTQEQPPYEKDYAIDTDAPITAKVFVIDDETHSTMLLSDEY